MATGRPPLPIGAHGKIVAQQQPSKLWQAHTYLRDADGETRRVKRTAPTKSGAVNALHEALSDRRRDTANDLTGSSRLSDAAGRWFAIVEQMVDDGDLAPNTARVYESAWRLHVKPALGALRLRELTVSRCEAWKTELRKRKGPATTRSARAVLSGALGYAARMGAIESNPVRDLSTITGRRKRPSRALTRTERAEWLSKMEADEKAARWAVPDLCRFLLATGCRIGEALAVTWDDVDFDAETVRIAHKIVRVKGDGLHRMAGAKSEAGVRLLKLPKWATGMLGDRRIDNAGMWPVFPDSFGGWRDPSNVQRVFRESRDAAGFEWVTTHVFRKTVLTVLDDAGISPRQVADVAGHSDPAMTQRVYMQRGLASAASADALEDLF